MNGATCYGEYEDESAKRERAETVKIARLSEIERDVITMVCYGLKDRQIAHSLGADETEVRAHLGAIYTKLGVSDRLDLVLYAYAHGLTTLPH